MNHECSYKLIDTSNKDARYRTVGEVWHCSGCGTYFKRTETIKTVMESKFIPLPITNWAYRIKDNNKLNNGECSHNFSFVDMTKDSKGRWYQVKFRCKKCNEEEYEDPQGWHFFERKKGEEKQTSYIISTRL